MRFIKSYFALNLTAEKQFDTLLKRAVVTQRKRQRESEDQSQELQHLRQMVTQYQEQLRTLEKSILGDVVTDLSLHYLTKAKIMATKDVERYELEFVTKILNCFLIPNIEHFRAENLGHADLISGGGTPEIELSRQLGAWAKVLHRMEGSV
uniref:Uncharacterized protein n=1 Tax=Brassica campestris TaxID=3711 RepID=A0A3P5ZZU9_BRACM|nr:unnamed protein product [Brassica rapa]